MTSKPEQSDGLDAQHALKLGALGGGRFREKQTDLALPSLVSFDFVNDVGRSHLLKLSSTPRLVKRWLRWLLNARADFVLWRWVCCTRVEFPSRGIAPCEIVRRLRGFRGRCEDGAFVCLQHVQPVGKILRVVGTRLDGDAELAAQERCAEFGDIS